MVAISSLWRARAMSAAGSMAATGGGAGVARLDFVRIVRVAAADVAPPHPQAVVLVLPDVAQLVGDQARRDVWRAGA